MRKFGLKAFCLGLMLTAAVPAIAQIKLNSVSDKEPVTGLSSGQFAQVVEQWLDASRLNGLPVVAMVNATNQELTVSCEDKWTIVGSDKYDDSEMRKNPDSLKPWTIYPYISIADSFDGYCKDGLTAHATHGNKVFVGKLNGSDFTHSTVIEFTLDDTK